MVNYGKILTPLGILLAIPGIIVASTGGAAFVFGPMLGLAALLFFVGLARLVQGKERKILGQLLRPKAAARSSAIWAFLFVNLMPIVLGSSEIYSYLEGPPFPLFILLSGSNVLQLGYNWLPFAFIGFLVIWFFGFIFSGKIPKLYYVFNLFMITLTFVFWMNFGVQFLLWTFLADKSEIVLMEPWVNTTTLGELVVPLSISGGILLFSLIMILKMMNNFQRGFSNFSVGGVGKIISFGMMILIYFLSIAPLYFGIANSLASQAYIAPYVNYIGIVFIAIIILRTVTSIINSAKDFAKKQTASGKKDGSPTAFGLSTAIFLLILFLAWAPIVLPLVDRGQNSKNNSIYNTDWNGWSNFREELENIYSEDNVMPIQSSISTIGQLNPNKHVILVIPGPNKFYNPASEIPYFLTAFKGNFSMFVCDDHGTTETLLLEMFFASLGAGMGIDSATPITLFPKGYLIDNSSYYQNTAYPVITNFNPHPITDSLSNPQVVLDHATAFLGGDILSVFGWNYIGYTSGEYSFVDTNNNFEYESTIDTYPFPGKLSDVLASQEDNPLGVAGAILDVGIPLGGYAQAVFSTKEIAYQEPNPDGPGYHSSRVFCASDASWINNQMTSIGTYDNMQLALNAIEWLACDRSPEETIIVFDEAHLLPVSGRTELNSASSFGTTQGYVNWLSTNPILGLVYPIFALQTLRKWIPKEGNKRKVQLKDLEEAERNRALLKFRTSSFFAQKINWYRVHHKYRQALLQLFRRIQRKVNRLLGETGPRNVDAIMAAIQRERGRYLSQNDYKRIRQFFEFMSGLKRNKTNIKDEREFEDWFLEMSWIGDHI